MVAKRKSKRLSVSAREIKEYAEKNNSVRISYHEKVCAERMKTLFKAIDEMRKDIKDLRGDMNKGKGAVAFLVILGGFIATIIGFFKFNG
jgi:uncharacterized coiled-coil DUF342 family protein|nr:hypothetical protein [uncultured Mediterranean phage uvMED]|tara:strand:+ start:296 stop:565 length:270 start_codon:yes stop_codon:yes gene_type:complete